MSDAGTDGGSGGCSSLADCMPGAVICEFPERTCAGPGRCLPLPDDCPVAQPECGCDGVTYDNPCLRMSAGVSKQSNGPCP